MVEAYSGFDWDAGNREKCQSHGVSLSEIQELFAHEVAVFPDVAHSDSEMRFLAIGRNLAGRHIFVAFTLRERDGERYLRPISARYMHRKEVDHYEKETATLQKR